MTTGTRFTRAVLDVVSEGNCSGCGGCAALSTQIEMRWSADGFVRPSIVPSSQPEAETDPVLVDKFRRVCPGIGLTAPSVDEGQSEHPVFGRYISAFQAWAADPAIRRRGSSAGVLTALVGWLVTTGQAGTVLGAAQSPDAPTTTVPVRITTREEAEAAAGSRYAPVAVLSALRSGPAPAAIVAKPCEVSAARGLRSVAAATTTSEPILLSFFCAGTPSQDATQVLVESLGVAKDDVSTLHYRGDGWPGRFRITTTSGRESSLSYEQSWGQQLGRSLQYRCKICVDGTGADADLSVGDFWRADARGFPTFESAEGNSVVLARTRRGHELLVRAVEEGVIHVSGVDLRDVESVQPLQSTRRRTLAGRLAGRRLAGHPVPRYRGYGLAALALRTPVRSLRAGLGSYVRSIRQKS